MLATRYEAALGIASRQIALPFDVPVLAGDCGSPRAYYSPDKKHIVICHEFVRLVAGDLVRYLTGLDFDTWWKRQRAEEIAAGIIGRWQQRDPLGGLGRETIVDLDYRNSGIGTVSLSQKEIESDAAPEVSASFGGFWGVGQPSFDQSSEWIWLLDAGTGSFFWSKIDGLSVGELQIDGFQKGSYKRVD